MAQLNGGFSLYKRSRKSGKPVYYAKIFDPKLVESEVRISTGQTSKTAAALWTQAYMEDLANEEQRKRDERLNITMKKFAEGFWDHDGEYANSRRARLRTVSLGFLDNRASLTKNHIIPYWGKYRLKDITARKVDRWVIDMASDNRNAPASVNQRLQVLKVMLDDACRQEYLKENPAQYVKPVANKYRKKGVLSLDEVKELLNYKIWPDYRQYAINLLTLATGIRIGEVRGLLVSQVQPDHVQIHTSWEENYGLKEPKCGSVRDLPISKYIYDVLQEVISSTGATNLVFYGKTLDTPMSKSYIEKSLYKALNEIGIPEPVRKQRNITFHSLRHTTNTIMRSVGIADSKVRMMTGHREESMTERYTHFRLEDFREIEHVQLMMVNQ